MTFTHRWMVVVLVAFVLGDVAPRLGPGPRAHAQTAPSGVAAVPTQAAPPPAPVVQQQAYTLPAEKLKKAIALSRIRNILDLVGSLWGLAVLWLLLSTRAAAGIEGWAKRVLRRRWMQGVLFFAVFLVVTEVAGLPVDMVGHHYSRAFGISVQGWGGWLGDQAKALGVNLALGVPVLLLFNWIVRRWPRRYWLGLWVVALPLMVAGVFISPLLDPIFNKFEPLTKDHAALVQKLETVVARTGTNIPPERMYLMKASAKTNGLNAYVTGLGATKRYVMWDTATDRMPDDEILFVFGHESGHYVLNHIPKMLSLMAVGLFVIFWACAGFGGWLVARYGERFGAPTLESRAGFLFLLFAVSVAGFVTTPLSNAMSRHFEHQADVYGQEAIHGLVADPQAVTVSAFNHLGEAWLEDPDPSPLIEFWDYNHPSVKNRANFAKQYDPWANGGHGEFFAK